MSTFTQIPAVLMLADGTLYHGFSIGSKGVSCGEICFNTSMTGYQELYTDPSYAGQIIVNTHVHMGNYGVMAHTESEAQRPYIKGCVHNLYSQHFSREEATSSLHDYLLSHGIVGIYGIDTRSLVKHLTKHGSMNAVVSTTLSKSQDLLHTITQTPSMEGLNLSAEVSTHATYTVKAEEEKYRIGIIDIGVKKSILRELTRRGASCVVFPYDVSMAEINEHDLDAYFLPNGPGDPASMHKTIDLVKQLLAADKPLMGICLGHQLLGLALGISTYKLKYGHRGSNHAVKNLSTGLCEMTSQNHGFSLVAEEVKKAKDMVLTHLNLNDQTVAGIQVKDKPFFSVQFHPESSPGPHDSAYLFDNFLATIHSQKLVSLNS